MDAGDTVWWDLGGTWNPVGGCKPVSTECANCYAAVQAGTLHQSAGAKREMRLLYDGVVDKRGGRYWFNGKPTELPRGHSSWNFPLDWPGADHPLLGDARPSLIFACDMTDLFYHERRLIDRVVGILGLSRHIGQLLTKRADVMAEYFTAPRPPSRLRHLQTKLWLGFSAGDQRWFDVRWSHMRALADADWTVFVSIAPMLGPVTLPADFLALGERGWVVDSGEQGPHKFCRDMNPAWARALRDQCAAAGVPFFMKQMAPREANPIPPDLMTSRCRQFPAVRLS